MPDNFLKLRQCQPLGHADFDLPPPGFRELPDLGQWTAK